MLASGHAGVLMEGPLWTGPGTASDKREETRPEERRDLANLVDEEDF